MKPYPRISFPDIDFKDGELYRPSNGTEGELFQEGWCYHCKRDAAFQADPDSADGCPILAASYAGDKVPQWVFRGKTPTCTEFEDEAIPDDPLSPEERAAQIPLEI